MVLPTILISDLSDYQIIVQAANHKLRPVLEKTTPKSFKDLITSSWSHEPENRPDVPTILKKLEEVQEEYQKDPISLEQSNSKGE